MPGRDDVIKALTNIRDEVASFAAAPADGWSARTDGEGWTARQVLSHIASTSGVSSFVMTLARGGQAAGPPADFDNDAFNRDQVALRAERSVAELVDETLANLQRDIQAAEKAPAELLQQHFKAPWDNEGTVAQVIIDSVNGHLGGHIADIRGALAG